ncbi:VacJ family lipoprotein [Phenylobacterium sp. LjRoot225]|uniref:MlaA family lipoprotein n=1 Tax=Phenylobacterium sp. LjRoot225 TaxID=3342285 RepID=UPI003ECCEC49
MTRPSRMIERRFAAWRHVGLGLAGALIATAAAAQPAAEPAIAPSAAANTLTAANTPIAYDPWQPVNRGLFAVGMGLDRVLIGPIAHGYMYVTPKVVRKRVSSVVFNLGEPSTALEDLLQGHAGRAGRTGVRFVVNSTVGLLGMFDVASGWGLRGHESDFGQTLGRYGAQTGPYVYLPVMGPLNLRDGVGRVVDVVTDPIGFVTGPITSTSGAIRTGVTALDLRASGDAAYRALEDATDPYVTTRSAYSQYRAAVIDRATGETATLPDFDPTPTPSE